MSFNFASASNSSSLPENFGVGQTAAQSAYAAGPVKKLTAHDQGNLDGHLLTARKLNSDDAASAPTEKELQALNSYIKLLIDDPTQEDVVNVLQSKVTIRKLHTDPFPTKEQAGINELGSFVNLIREKRIEIGIIEQKFKTGAQLSHLECQLVDRMANFTGLATKLSKSGNNLNPHVEQFLRISRIAAANSFREFQDGDILFYDIFGRMAYRGQDVAFADKTTASVLGTHYTHVGVFFRDDDNRPCVAQIQGKYGRQFLGFGEQSFIKGKRIDPSKLTAAKLTEQEKLDAQKKIGHAISLIASEDHKFGITMAQQFACIMSHTTSNPEAGLGKTLLDRTVDKNGKGVDYLCSEFAIRSVMEAVHRVNNNEAASKEGNAKFRFESPISEFEKVSTVHPERLLTHFGPHKGKERVDSAWEDVMPLSAGENFLPMGKILPDPSPFPEASKPKSPFVPAPGQAPAPPPKPQFPSPNGL